MKILTCLCPSEYIIERMLHKGLLLPIDTVFAHSPNYMKGIAPFIREQIDKLTVKGQRPAKLICGVLYVGYCRIALQ